MQRVKKWHNFWSFYLFTQKFTIIFHKMCINFTIFIVLKWQHIFDLFASCQLMFTFAFADFLFIATPHTRAVITFKTASYSWFKPQMPQVWKANKFNHWHSLSSMYTWNPERETIWKKCKQLHHLYACTSRFIPLWECWTYNRWLVLSVHTISAL